MHDQRSDSVINLQACAPRVYAADVEPLLRSLLATLADMEFAHESEVAKVNGSAAHPAMKCKLIARLDERHRERRKPYVQELALLQSRIQRMLVRG
jgi:hypothetical protein